MSEKVSARTEWERLQQQQDELCIMLGRACQRHEIRARVANLIDTLDAISEAMPEGFREDREHNLVECVEALVKELKR